MWWGCTKSYLGLQKFEARLVAQDGPPIGETITPEWVAMKTDFIQTGESGYNLMGQKREVIIVDQ